METKQILKKYFTGAVPLALLIIGAQHATEPGFLNDKIRGWTMSFNFEHFMIHRGAANRDDDHGPDYYEKLRLKVYSKEQGEQMALKEFMVEHIRSYEACLFKGLALDWPALTKWDINDPTGSGKQYLSKNVTDLVETTEEYPGGDKRDYVTFGGYFHFIENAMVEDPTSNYMVRNGYVDDVAHTLVQDLDLTEGLAEDLWEPNVTEQILDLDRTFIEVLEQGFVTDTMADKFDRLTCVVSGMQTWSLVSAWQRGYLFQGRKEPQDIASEEFRSTRVHTFTLQKGDCIYVPAYWWYQVEVPKEAPSLSVTFKYDGSSTWVDLIYDGVNSGVL